VRGRLGSVTCVVTATSMLLAVASAHAGAGLRAAFVQQGPKLTASDEVKTTALGIAGGQFGHALALSADGKTAVVGAYNDANGQGAAWVFTRAGSSWKQDGHKVVPNGNVGEAHFGESVALSADGKTALIGGSQFGGGLGAVWVFTRSGSAWNQTRILSSGPVGAQAFGVSVALSSDGNVALVGASFYNLRVGAAFLYRRAGTAWKQLGRILMGVGEVGTPAYGSAVALSADGSMAAIGGPYNGSGGKRLGAVWTYGVTSSGWKPTGAKLVASDAVQDGSFGQSVALSAHGDSLLVGSNRGAAWIFARSGSSWKQRAKLTAPIPSASMFGYSVGLSAAGTTAVVGAPYDGGGAGSSWVFSGSGTHWGQASKLASNGSSGLVELGWGVALSSDGKTALIGGPSDANGFGAAWAQSQG
jgi:FG-GAP repeat protein